MLNITGLLSVTMLQAKPQLPPKPENMIASTKPAPVCSKPGFTNNAVQLPQQKSVLAPSTKKYPAPPPPVSGFGSEQRTATATGLDDKLPKVGNNNNNRPEYIRSPMQVMHVTRAHDETQRIVTALCSNSKSQSNCRSNKMCMKSAPMSRSAVYAQPSVDKSKTNNLKPRTEMVISDGYIKLRTASETKSDNVKVEAGENRPASVPAMSDPRPVVKDVKLVTPGDTIHKTKSRMRSCKSSNAIDRLELLLDAEGDPEGQSFLNRLTSLRSSFVDPCGPPTRCSVYIELGEYQTLLKHSKKEEDRVYSLPQPQCYSDDTLKAVRLITEKYDTFKRRQLRAMSFRGGLGSINDDDGSASDQQELLGQTSDSSQIACVGTDDRRKVNSLVCEGEASGYSAFKNLRTSSVQNDVGGSSGVQDAKMLESVLLRDYFPSLQDTCETYALGGISRLDRIRIEMFYRSRSTQVFVSKSLADVFVGACIEGDSTGQWIHTHTGVPLWLLNTGSAVRKRELVLVIAERETGFPLWQDTVNYLSNYHEISDGAHALRISGSLSKMIKLNLFCENAAREFMEKFHEITSDPNDELWKISGERSENRRRTKIAFPCQRRRRHIEKSSISHPCNFVHVSRVDPKEANFRAAFADLLPLFDSSVSRVGNDENLPRTADCEITEFRPRLPTR